jgi:hypothetical protein
MCSTAHVYVLELGPELSHEDVDFMTYDDATQQLLAVKGGHVFAYDVSVGPAGHSSLKWMYPLQVCVLASVLTHCRYVECVDDLAYSLVHVFDGGHGVRRGQAASCCWCK